jgi:hypothetical protein
MKTIIMRRDSKKLTKRNQLGEVYTLLFAYFYNNYINYVRLLLFLIDFTTSCVHKRELF